MIYSDCLEMLKYVWIKHIHVPLHFKKSMLTDLLTHFQISSQTHRSKCRHMDVKTWIWNHADYTVHLKDKTCQFKNKLKNFMLCFYFCYWRGFGAKMVFGTDFLPHSNCKSERMIFAVHHTSLIQIDQQQKHHVLGT